LEPEEKLFCQTVFSKKAVFRELGAEVEVVLRKKKTVPNGSAVSPELPRLAHLHG
jgi:hypothetical protein